MAVREGNSRQMTNLPGELYAKVARVSEETGLSVSKVLSASAAALVDPRGKTRENANAKEIAKVVRRG